MFAKKDTCDIKLLCLEIIRFHQCPGKTHRKQRVKKLLPLAKPIGSMWYIDLHLVDFHGN